MLIKFIVGNSLGGPVVRTLSFHCRGHRFNPWSGNLRSCRPRGTAKKKKNTHTHKNNKKLIVVIFHNTCKYTLNLYSDVCQLYLNKTERKKNKSLVSTITSSTQYCTLASREKREKGGKE